MLVSQTFLSVQLSHASRLVAQDFHSRDSLVVGARDNRQEQTAAVATVLLKSRTFFNKQNKHKKK